MLVFSKNRKFLCFWTLGTSILTSEKNYPNVFCSDFPNLPNAVFRFSLTCVVFEIVGGGRKSTPPPGRWCSAETTGCARVKVTFRDHDLHPISEAKNLGLTFDRSLSWTAHVCNITKSCFGVLSGLSHLRGHLPPAVILTLVDALVV